MLNVMKDISTDVTERLNLFLTQTLFLKFGLQSSYRLFCVFCKARRRGEKERTVEKPSKKGMGRWNLALTRLHSLKIKLVHHTRSHTHIHTSPFFRAQFRHSSSSPTHNQHQQKHIRIEFAINHEKLQTFHFLALFFLTIFINIRFGIPNKLNFSN